jgi:hypothetical protein
MAVDDFEHVQILDARAGFYMVPCASIAKARARLTGAHLTEALAALICLARESYHQHGASREEQQGCEVNLQTLASDVLGVGRARALRIVEHLADAGALTKEAHRFDPARGRLPTQITFVDCAVPFAYVSGQAFGALAAVQASDTPSFGPLALYLALVALGGEQRQEFPDGNRRIARASHPELARLSGLSVSSIKRALEILKRAELLIVRPQPSAALKTAAVYRLTDPTTSNTDHLLTSPRGCQPRSAAGPDHPATTGQLTTTPTTDHTDTDDSPPQHRPTGHPGTDDSSPGNRSTVHSAPDRQSNEPTRAYVRPSQITDAQNNHLPLPSAPAPATGGEQDDIDRIISTFSAWIRQALGEHQLQRRYDAASWQKAAQQLLEHYDLDRILAGIERLSRDALLADRATTLPAFTAIAERAITRAAADRGYIKHRQSTSTGPSWSDAFAAITRAIRHHGEAGKSTAREQLVARHPAYGPFIDTVGWTTLCREKPERHDYDWKRAWEQACNSTSQEAAA